MASQSDWLLSEASDAANVWRDTFNDVLKSGRVPLRGKRTGWRADPIEHWLPRIRKVSILLVANEITLWLDLSSADERRIAEQLARYPGVLLPSDSTIKFTDVRVHWPALGEELAASGFAVSAARLQRRGAYRAELKTFMQRFKPEALANLGDDAIALRFIDHVESKVKAGQSGARFARIRDDAGVIGSVNHTTICADFRLVRSIRDGEIERLREARAGRPQGHQTRHPDLD